MAATAITFLEAPQRYRITCGQNAAPSTSTTSYTLTRVDGSYCAPNPALVWVDAGNPDVAELALAEPLLEGVLYSLAVAGAGAAEVAFRAPQAHRDVKPDNEGNPAAEIFGTDVSWLVDTLGPGRRLLRRSGRAALSHDLGTIAVIAPGELFHLPSDGVGLPRQVNGPGSDNELKGLAAAVRRQWARDRRVKRGSVIATASADGTGLVEVSGGYEAAATGEADTIRTRA